MAEINDSFIDSARTWLRISTRSRDDEIRQTILACLIDLGNGGVDDPDLDSPLVQQAVKLYLKAQFGYDSDAEKFSRSYEFLKASMALSGTV